MNKTKAKIINLTPHSVKVVSENNDVVAEYPSEGVLRLSETREKIGEINGIPVYKKSYGNTQLPEKKEGVYYIVSLPVAQTYPERDDFLIPDQLIRDEKGRVIGCRAFGRIGWVRE